MEQIRNSWFNHFALWRNWNVRGYHDRQIHFFEPRAIIEHCRSLPKVFLKWGRCLLGDFQSEVVSDHSSDFMLRCHIYRMDRRRRNFYKYLCLLCSLQISLTSFPKSPLITRFRNVVQLTPFIVFHSLRVVLVVSDQVSPFTQTGLLCY